MNDDPINPAEMNEPKKSQKRWIYSLLALYSLAIVAGLAGIFIRKSDTPKSPETISGSLPQMKKGPAIAVISIYGVISVADEGTLLRPMTSDRIVKRLKSLSEREDVKAVVMRINSPGGSVGAVQEIYDEVIRLKKTGKKVVVSMGDVAASGGYYVAAAADTIFADAGTLTGSIGVIFELGNVQELFKKVGIKMEAIKSAEHKDIASPFRAVTEKERQILQTLINDAYDQFVTAIVQGRNMDKTKVLALADGRIFTGSQAKSAGLIDELGNLESAIAKAQEMTGLKEKPRIFYDEEPWEKFFSFLETRTNLWHSALSRFGVRFAYVWPYAW